MAPVVVVSPPRDADEVGGGALPISLPVAATVEPRITAAAAADAVATAPTTTLRRS